MNHGAGKAKLRLTIVDEILAPEEEMRISYSGKNPFLIATIILPLLREILKVSSTNLFEEDIRWDILGEMKTFYGVWRGIEPHDKWTYGMFRVYAQGGVNKENEGWVDIRLKGWLRTEFGYGNQFTRSWWWLYNYMFYWKQRRMYIDYDADIARKIKEEILTAYNILREE